MLGYLVEDLTIKDKKGLNEKMNSAKGIMLRNQIEDYIRPEVLEKLERFDYDESTDASLPREDAFEPLSRPIDDYL